MTIHRQFEEDHSLLQQHGMQDKFIMRSFYKLTMKYFLDITEILSAISVKFRLLCKINIILLIKIIVNMVFNQKYYILICDLCSVLNFQTNYMV